MDFRVQLNKFGNEIKAHSPEILLVSGLIEGAVGTFLACRSTYKAKDLKKYDFKDKKSKLAAYIDISKDYLPAAGCLIAGGVSICASHGIMKRRYAGIVSAYGALTTSFLEYRKRVREEVGEKREEELYYGTEKESISVKVTQKDGKERKVNKKVDIRTKNGLSPYAQLFDPKEALDEENPYYVDSFLVTKENYANDMLKAVGHLYLNDIRKELGMEIDDAGQIVGWIYDPYNVKDGERDNQIRFIKKEIYVEQEDGSYKPELWLDFNVDGPIFGKMSKKEYNTYIHEAGDQGIEFSNKED